MITEIILLISAVLLIVAILMQSRGAGLGGAIGGGDEIHHTKRGAEKGLFILTIIFSVVFLLSAFINVLLF